MSRDEEPKKELLAYLDKLAKRIHPRREELVDLVIEAVREQVEQVTESEKAAEEASRLANTMREMEEAAEEKYQQALTRTSNPAKASQVARKAREAAQKARDAFERHHKQSLFSEDLNLDHWVLDWQSPPSTKPKRARYLALIHDVCFPGEGESIFLAAQKAADPEFRFAEIDRKEGHWPKPEWFALAALVATVRRLDGNPVPLIPTHNSDDARWLELIATRLNEWSGELLPEDDDTLRTDSNLVPPRVESEPDTDIESLGIDHENNFRDVRWGKEIFEFTVIQAACVQELFEHREKGYRGLSQVEILDRAGSSCSRLRDVFRRNRKTHPAWGTMIVPTESQGRYRIANPNGTAE